ncbi:type I restriction-modification system subunit M [Geomonas ferrireducens]|uniref:type I restriction-modification system subunit M n=1 Tax=Geomonas ferrireducens TaxID=2570227 RepID=UPI0010A901BF|nr:type I restriction-modification system subunit M [Geomonas ferrireducens]
MSGERCFTGDQDHIRENRDSFVKAFPPAVRDIFDRFDLHAQVARTHKCGFLSQVEDKFSKVDLHLGEVDYHQVGIVFQEQIRKFAEISSETACKHFTQRQMSA